MKNPLVIKKTVDVDLSSTDWTLAGSSASKGYGPPDALYVGTAAGGDVVCQITDNAPATATTFTGLSGGVWHPISVIAITKTGTTAALQTAGILKVGWVR